MVLAYYNSFQYKGSGENEDAAIRANNPIPEQCSLFYFEVDIIDKGNNGYVVNSWTYAFL